MNGLVQPRGFNNSAVSGQQYENGWTLLHYDKLGQWHYDKFGQWQFTCEPSIGHSFKIAQLHKSLSKIEVLLSTKPEHLFSHINIDICTACGCSQQNKCNCKQRSLL